MQMYGRDALRPVPTGRGAVHVQHQEKAGASEGCDGRGCAAAAGRWVGFLEEEDERQPFFVGNIVDIGAGASFVLHYKGDRPRGSRRVEVPGVFSGALHANVSREQPHLLLQPIYLPRSFTCLPPFSLCLLCMPATCRSKVAKLENIRSVFIYVFSFSLSLSLSLARFLSPRVMVRASTVCCT